MREQMSPNTTIKITRGLAYVLLTLVPTFWVGAMPAQRTQARVSTAPLLTKVAEAVVPVHNWGFATDGRYDWHPHYWLSPTEVLFFTSPTRKQFSPFRHILTFVKIDIRTGKETRLTHLADLFNLQPDRGESEQNSGFPGWKVAALARWATRYREDRSDEHKWLNHQTMAAARIFTPSFMENQQSAMDGSSGGW
jgi:hypothetical protein